MSQFSNALTSALDSLHWQQKDLAAAASLTRSQANRAVRGTVAVGPDVVTKIIQALPSPYNGAILAAYVRDTVPEGFGHLVEIKSVTAKDHAQAETLPEDLDPKLRSLIISFAKRAAIRTEFGDLLRTLGTALDAR